VQIHLVTRTIAVVLNIGIDTNYQERGGISDKIVIIESQATSFI
jgi:hypothetical protein